jgi:hypothetical protein
MSAAELEEEEILEDWETANFTVQINHIINDVEVLKLKNQKLVEDADLALSEDLFGNTRKKEVEHSSTEPTITKMNVEKMNVEKVNKEDKGKGAKIQEKKQNRLKIKKEKEQVAEVFGEVEEDEYYLQYCKYEDSVLG